MSAKGERIRKQKQAEAAARAAEWTPEKRARVEARRAESDRVNAVRAARIAGKPSPDLVAAQVNMAHVDGPQAPSGQVPAFVLAARAAEQKAAGYNGAAQEATGPDPEKPEETGSIVKTLLMVAAVVVMLVLIIPKVVKR